MSRNLRLNNSGCKDPTAYEALKPIIDRDLATEKLVHKLIAVVKNIVDLSGFELVGRIGIKHKESGREFK